MLERHINHMLCIGYAGQITLDALCTDAHGTNVGYRGAGLLFRPIVVDHHVCASLCERQCNSATEALRSASDQGGTIVQVH
jgi:hypothetical protein